MSDIVLTVDGVSKKFCRDLKTSMVYASTDLVKGFVGLPSHLGTLRKNEFWALDDISFELKRGETLGLLGVNGSGKTTLLKLIAGLFPPDKGTIKIKGRVASLIAVGAGFHPHLTGRENIYLNGAILGLSKNYINKMFDWIVDFAEVEKFLEAPVSTYSSGMRIRLGFAIASCSEPDLLLLDEILAVGDRKFKVKCFNRISEIQKKSALVFVSHNSDEVARVCQKVLLLEKGRDVFLGDTSEGINLYVSKGEIEQRQFVKCIDGISVDEISIDKKLISWGDVVKFDLAIISENNIKNAIIRVTWHDESGKDVANWQSFNHDIFYNIEKGKNTLSGIMKNISLKRGKYSLSFVLSSEQKTDYLAVAHEAKQIVVSSFDGYTGYQI